MAKEGRNEPKPGSEGKDGKTKIHPDQVIDDEGNVWPLGCLDPKEDDRITREARAARLARLGR